MRRLIALYLPALLRKIAIRYRLLASFILISLTPLLVSGYISYAESSRAIEQKTRLFTTEVVKQIAKNVQLRMAEIESDSETLVLSDPVQYALARYALDSPEDKGRARAALTKILLDSYGSFQDFGQKYFLDRDNHVLDPQVFAQLGRGVVEFSAAARASQRRVVWGALELWDGQKSIAMVRQIYSKNDNRLMGGLLLGVRATRFAAIFDNASLGAGSDIFIVDARDGTLLVQRRERAATVPAAPALLEQLAASMRGGEQSGFLAYQQTVAEGHPPAGYFAVYTQVPNTSWYVVSTLPNQLLLAEAQAVRKEIVLIGLICFCGALVLAYVVARSISMPLERLAGAMRATRTGDYAQRVEYEGRDELALLAQKFNDMAANIRQTHEQLESRVAERTRDLEQANLKLAALTLTDPLTGIANRRRFDEMLASELHRAARCSHPLALLMIDVDFFKSYNDHYGHQEGDSCLRKVATLLQTHARRASDLAARYGGEEFVMLAAETDADAALALAEQVRLALESLHLPHALSPIGWVSISVGVAVQVPDELQTPELFLRMADKAMYRAKEQGRNQVVLAGRK
ncbi:MAG TPA: diguanylate cyclase [Burkholderiaceae bacterium]|nr:diguanylate cyclase [Burkholderiaceae bacterium]